MNLARSEKTAAYEALVKTVQQLAERWTDHQYDKSVDSIYELIELLPKAQEAIEDDRGLL